MKYIVSKENRLCTVYARVGRDGETVVWMPQRKLASELEKDTAEAIVVKTAGAVMGCAECGGRCDVICDSILASLQGKFENNVSCD